jgi:hypothetical protein
MLASNHSTRRSWVALLLGGAVLLAAVLVSEAAAGPSSNGPPQTRVYGGGNIPIYTCTDGANMFCTQVTREFSMLAIHDPNEDVTYGTISVGNPERDHGINSVVRVTCLAVSGDVAEVGGVIVQDPNNPSFVGGPFEMFVRDSGQPGAVSRDGVSPVFSSPPPGKATCNDVSRDAFGYGFFPLTYGDVAVENVGNQNS